MQSLDLLGQAILMEKKAPDSSYKLLDNETNCIFIETVKEKLKGLMIAGLVENNEKKLMKTLSRKIEKLLDFAKEHTRAKQKASEERVTSSTLPGTSAGKNMFVDFVRQKDEKPAAGEPFPAPKELRLSDTNLRTLLQNFTILTSQEQQNLVWYLKRLETKDPDKFGAFSKYIPMAMMKDDCVSDNAVSTSWDFGSVSVLRLALA